MAKLVSFRRVNVVRTIYIMFDDEQAGYNRIRTDSIAASHNAVPIDRITVDTRLNGKKLSYPVIKEHSFLLCFPGHVLCIKYRVSA